MLKFIETRTHRGFSLFVYKCDCGKRYSTYDNTSLPNNCGRCKKKSIRTPGRPEILTDEYKQWRKKVFARGQFKCACCGEKQNLVAHHLNSWNWDIAGRYKVENGICLCGGKRVTKYQRTPNCHDNFHKLYGTGNNTIHQFEHFMQKYFGKSLSNLGYTL